MKHLPPDARALIEALDKLYPARPPRLAATDREVWFEAGQRAVVDHLISLRDRQDRREDDRILE
jgi:hypothetical protein